MYVILVNDDNTLTTTIRSRIMQRSKLFDDLLFLVKPEYNGHSMSKCTVLLEYVLPASKKYRTEILVMSEDMYEGYLKYSLPVDTKMTTEPGDIELQLSFVYSDLDINGHDIQRVRKTVPTSLTITPISAWSDIIPDSALTALDQRIIKMDAQMKALNEMSVSISQNKADDIAYNEDTNELQLVAEGYPIGRKVALRTPESDPDGIVIVDLSNFSGDYDDGKEDEDEESDVLEF